MNEELVNRLLNRYGYNSPIMTAEVLEVWGEYSRPQVFRLLKEYVENEVIKKFDMGVYYIATDTIIGKSSLDPQKVIEKRYIQSNGDVYGYYTGLLLLNELGLTTQMPYMIEVVTERETTRVREIKVGKARVLLRRAKTQITKENTPVLQLLDVFKDIAESLEPFQINRIIEFIKRGQIKEKDLYNYGRFYPKRAIENILKSEVRYALA